MEGTERKKGVGLQDIDWKGWTALEGKKGWSWVVLDFPLLF